MKHPCTDETRHVFRVRCDVAQQVRLVIERRGGVSQAFPLERCGPGTWQTTLDLAPGEYRYCYHAYTGRTLTYLTPPDAPLDGLKAVLRIDRDDVRTSQPPAPVGVRGVNNTGTFSVPA